MLDLDHFKRINDQNGHDVGDRVLQEFAQLLNDLLRTEDKLARVGGEEFVIYLHEASTEHAREIVNKIVAVTAATPVLLSGEKLYYTVSVGGVKINDEIDFSTVMSKADKCFYQAKQNGRNQAFLSFETDK